MESHIRSLKALGVGPDTYGTILSSVLLNKLPSELRLIISRKISNSALNINTLLAIMGEELTARERTHTATQLTPRQTQEKEKTRPTAATLFSGTASAHTPTCYCDQSNLSADCTSVTGADDRKQILRKTGRCFNCLRRGHLGRNCRSTGKCVSVRGGITQASARGNPMSKCSLVQHNQLRHNPQVSHRQHLSIQRPQPSQPRPH